MAVAPSGKAPEQKKPTDIDELQEVEAIIRSKLSSEAGLLEQIPSYLLELGGKRVRPMLCLLVAKLCGLNNPPKSVLDVSAGIELIHMATLLHDDIVDRSPLRRGKEAPYLRFGMTNTLLAGDFLLVRAFALCAHLDSFIVDKTESACVALTEGEILETSLNTERHTLESSINIADKKTASLFSLAAVCGSYLAEQPMETVQAFERCGRNLGIAFQILDDVLDVTADENLLGKRSGVDIVERKPSLVNVLWLESGSHLAKEVLLGEDELSEAKRSESLKVLRDSENAAVKQAKSTAIDYALRSKRELEGALSLMKGEPLEEPLAQLQYLINFTVERFS